MTLSIRLDPDTEAALRRRLLGEGVSLSAFVRDAIREKLAREASEPDPYTLGSSLFGRYSSGDGDRSTRRKEIVRERLDDEHRR